LVVAKADNLEKMELCAGTLNGLINFEIDSHIKLFASYGIPQSQIKNADEKHNNIAYTRFVLESGYSGDFLDLFTPLIACVLGYAEIGKNIAHYKPEKQMIQAWIDAYSGAKYQSLSRDVGTLFDRSVDLRLGLNFEEGYKWASLKKKFVKVTALEIDFWEMDLL
jgi:thiaminase/transcriptional activator TenA